MMMREVGGLTLALAPQALKGSLTAPAVAEAMRLGALEVFPAAALALAPIADGGEGTTQALVTGCGGELREALVTGPLGERVVATYGLLAEGAWAGGRTAVIEMAAAAGLPLTPEARRDPRRTTTRGVGELMRLALDAGCTRLIVGLGGSATNDGGAGMAQALGARLLDAAGDELEPGGAALARLASIDTSGLDARLRAVEVVAACDVTNPLCGAEGASAVYGPQKGATTAMVEELDAALGRYAALVRRDLGVDVAETPGAGAAGGLGAGLLAFAGAQMQPGAELVIEALGLRDRLAGAALLLTAEGRLDEQTAFGKSVEVVARLARETATPVVALCGSVALDAATLERLGIAVALPIADGPMSLEQSMAEGAALVTRATARALRLVRLGRELAMRH